MARLSFENRLLTAKYQHETREFEIKGGIFDLSWVGRREIIDNFINLGRGRRDISVEI